MFYIIYLHVNQSVDSILITPVNVQIRKWNLGLTFYPNYPYTEPVIANSKQCRMTFLTRYSELASNGDWAAVSEHARYCFEIIWALDS